ncbi:MAG: peroxiredoxin family protein, partial [Acidimicrobiales bacterium]
HAPTALRTAGPGVSVASRPTGSISPPTTPKGAPLAPNGDYTTPTGSNVTIASLRGKPTLVWFVAGGCASCSASIPAVASHFAQLTSNGLQVLTLGLYGNFPQGKKGAVQLVTFGRAATAWGSWGNIERPGWTWGMASESLSMAYDPTGTPDVYTLIGPQGHIRYRNSVPVSTMAQLLAAVRSLDQPLETKSPNPTPPPETATPTATLP